MRFCRPIQDAVLLDLLEVDEILSSHRGFRRRGSPQTFCQNQPQIQGFSEFFSFRNYVLEFALSSTPSNAHRQLSASASTAGASVSLLARRESNPDSGLGRWHREHSSRRQIEGECWQPPWHVPSIAILPSVNPVGSAGCVESWEVYLDVLWNPVASGGLRRVQETEMVD
ncbi:hypothetical protein SCHPADRAFT_933473, partial [Schizopora paradoxa]